jgi:DNA-directed RNA polymerase subunit M/transcription elongation factor TFIIS
MGNEVELMPVCPDCGKCLNERHDNPTGLVCWSCGYHYPPLGASTPSPLTAEQAKERARKIVKHISDAAIELAFVRHSLTNDELDIDDDADVKARVAAVEELEEDVKRDVFNCLTGDDTGCLDESELNETNCELLWLASKLMTVTPSPSVDATAGEK